jgi:ribosomal protein L11 methyltransferase
MRLTIGADDLQQARSLAGVLGELLAEPPLAVTEFGAGEPKPLDMADCFVVEALFAGNVDCLAVEAVLRDAGAAVPAQAWSEVPDLNWVAMSQSALPPVVAGRFVVHGSHDRARIGHRPNAILIDAGEAFGTAHHATTHGCLLALDRLARGGDCRRVLDLGCGTGVLAIAAGRLFPAALIAASDIDPIATMVAAANARANGARGRIRFVTATGFAHPLLRRAGSFDLVVANILAGPLIALAGEMRNALRRGGRAILSGLLAHQAAEVIAHYRAQDFRVIRRHVDAGWATLTLERR